MRYYRHQFWGDKEAFFWGFAASRTPYFLNPNYLQEIGMMVDDPNKSLRQQGDKFCGLSMLHSDFFDDPENPHPLSYIPKPLFMHTTQMKSVYDPEINFFQAAQTCESAIYINHFTLY